MINYISIYLLSILAILQIFVVIINYGFENQKKQIILFFCFIMLIVAEYFLKESFFNFYTISLGVSLLVIIMIRYDNLNENSLQFLIATSAFTFLICLLAEFRVNPNSDATVVPRGIAAVVLLLFFLSGMFYLLLTHLAFYYKQKIYIDAIKKLSLFIQITLFVMLAVEAGIVNDLLPRLETALGSELKRLNYLVEAFDMTFYTLIILLSMARIYEKEKTKVGEYIQFIQERKSEIQIVDIMKDLVLKSEDFDMTLENLLNIACYLTKADGGIIFLYEKEERTFFSKKINGYIIPPFFVNEKILENEERLKAKIKSTSVDDTMGLFKRIKESCGAGPEVHDSFVIMDTSSEIISIKNENLDPSREVLSYLRDFQNNIGAVIAAPIQVKSELFGFLYLGKNSYNFEDSDKRIVGAISSLTGVLIDNIQAKMMEKEKERLQNEMKIAEQIQTGILPRNFNIPEYTISAFMKPAEEVGGDYYDIINAPDGNYWINIGDVTGHGVTSGLIMMMLQTAAITTIFNNPSYDPAEVTVHSNRIVHNNIKERLMLDQFVTTCFVKMDKEGNLQFAGAHESMLVYRKKTKEVEVIKTNGIWIGLMEDISFGTEAESLSLESGDVLLLYTDGVIEIQNKDNVQYDVPRLKKFIAANGEKEPEEISELLIHELEDYKYQQTDDITYVIIRKD